MIFNDSELLFGVALQRVSFESAQC